MNDRIIDNQPVCPLKSLDRKKKYNKNMTEKNVKISRYEYMINISAVGMWINCMIKMASSMIKGIKENPKSVEVCTGRNCAKCPVAQSADPSVLSSPKMEQLETARYILS